MLKKISLFILSLLLMTGCTTETKKKSFNIVVTNFPCYDFVRAITKNDQDISIKMLIKPGMDSHSYESHHHKIWLRLKRAIYSFM